MHTNSPAHNIYKLHKHPHNAHKHAYPLGRQKCWVQTCPSHREAENVAAERTCRPRAISGSQPAGTVGSLPPTRKWHSYSSKPSSQHPTCLSGDSEAPALKGRPSCAGLFLCWRSERQGAAQRSKDGWDVTTFPTGLPGAEGNSLLSEMICFYSWKFRKHRRNWTEGDKC